MTPPSTTEFITRNRSIGKRSWFSNLLTPISHSSGKKITTSGIDKWRIVDGKVVEHFKGVNDQMDFFKQLGVIDYTKKAKKLFPEAVS